MKGSQLKETNDGSGRLLTPSINGRCVTWSQAIDTVASRFNEVIEEHGPDAVAFYVSGQLLTEDYYVANKLMKGFIGSANIDTNSRLCMSSAVAAYKRSLGEDAVPCNYEDLETADLLVLVGSNAAWTHPVLFQRIERARSINPDIRVVCIDPRKTATSAMADLHLMIKPGTDVALFNGLLNFMNLCMGINHEFVNVHTEGFGNTLKATERWSVEKVANYCDVDVADLNAFYQSFTQTEKVVSVYSMGVNQSSQGVDKANSIINCHLAGGKIGKPGSGPFSMTGQPNAMGGREVGGLANMLAAHMDIENPEHRERVQRFWRSPTIAHKQGLKAIDLFDRIDKGKVKAVWVMATNPAFSMPNRQKVEQALEKCDFVVVSDCVAETDTLKYANVKFPATGWSEKNGTVTNSERRISRQRGVLPPLGDAKHDWQIICDVASAMGFSDHFNYHNPHEIFREHARLTCFENNGERLLDLSELSNLTQQEYDQLKPVQWPVNRQHPQGCDRLFKDNRFPTASGKAKFIPVDAKLPMVSVNQSFPFVLNSGRVRDQWHSMTRTGKHSGLTQHIEQAFVYIHPKDAKTLHIKDGDLVAINAAHCLSDQVVLPAKLDEGTRRKEVFVPIHWNEQWASSSCTGKLYTDAHDSISGQPELKHSAVSLTKVTFNTRAAFYSHKPLADKSLSAIFPYWVKTLFDGGYCYFFASEKTFLEVDNLCRALVDDTESWVNHSQSDSCISVGLRNNDLVSVIASGDGIVELDSHWVQSLVKAKELSVETVSGLLRKDAGRNVNHGEMICSCFSVSQNTIQEAIEQGFNSVEALGRHLKCGTNCGSCKPELAKQIADTNQNKEFVQEIPIVELEAVS